MKKLICLFLFFLICLNCSYAQISRYKKLTQALDRLISERSKSVAPGCVVLVARKGEIIYLKAFGIANLELNVPMQPNMIFRLGSLTKQYTAVAILQLVDQGKISLQDSIQTYVKDFPSKGFTITIENLLTHTSGIKDYQSIADSTPGWRNYTPKEGVAFFKNEPLGFRPGSQFQYSNSNYYLLGYIIEIVSGKTYPKYMQENLFNKAELSNTFYNEQEKIIPGRVTGYTKVDSLLENADFLSMTVPYAAGALMANAEDLFKWHQALYAHKLLTKKTLDKAFSPFKLDNGKLSDYGYGWFLKDIEGSKTIEHTGAIDGFRADEIYMPTEDVFVATLFNCLDYKEDWMALSNDIARIAIGKPLRNEITVSQDILDSYVGTYRSDSILEVGFENYFKDKSHTRDSLTIHMENKKLYADLSNRSGMNLDLSAQSETMFLLPDVRRIRTTIEFIVDNGKVTGLYWTQERKSIWSKIK